MNYLSHQGSNPLLTSCARVVLASTLLLFFGLTPAKAGRCDAPRIESRKGGATSEVVEAVLGTAAALDKNHGGVLAKPTIMSSEEKDQVIATCKLLRDGSQVALLNAKEAVLFDRKEIYLGDWIPGFLSFAVEFGDVAIACHYEKTGIVGEAVLHDIHSVRLDLAGTETSYLMAPGGAGANGVIYAIDPDGNILGGPSLPGIPDVDDLDDDMVGEDNCTEMDTSGRPLHEIWARCYQDSDGDGLAPSSDECFSCCDETLEACRDECNSLEFICGFQVARAGRNCKAECRMMSTSDAQLTVTLDY